MDIKVHVEIPALDRLVDALKAGVAPAALAAADKPKPADKPKAEPKAAPAAEPKGEPKAEPKAEQPASDAGDVDEEGLRNAAKQAAIKLQQKSGKEALTGLLADYGVPNLSGLSVEQLPAFTQDATDKAA